MSPLPATLRGRFFLGVGNGQLFSFGTRPVRSFTCPPKGRETEIVNVHENHGVGSVTALLLVVSWRPLASYQLPLDSVVCAGAVFVVLSWFYSSLAKSSLAMASMRTTAREKSL
jgi:hypothetical protein